MNMCRTLGVGAVVLLLFFSAFERADARNWKPTASSRAMDYVQITDNRSENELVMIWWIASEAFIVGQDLDQATANLLREYVIVAVVHMDISPVGQFTFRSPTGVLVKTSADWERQPIAEESFPPLLVGFLSILKSMLAQGLGPLGEGIRWFVFDGKGIESCGNGLFWVSYAGEQYDYKTPIPGCP